MYHLRAPVRFGLVVGCLSLGAVQLCAQQGAGHGFLFRAPVAALSVHGGLAQPLARSDLFAFTTRELTLGRSDFLTSNFGVDLAISASPRMDVVVGFDRGLSRTRSEFRDWVDNNNLPIEQTTAFERLPVTASLRYHLAERGREIGSLAWVPTQFVPFVGAGVGVMRYSFVQSGDFIDAGTLNIFSDRLVSKGWTAIGQAHAGAHWNINQHIQLTGEIRYLYGRDDASRPERDFVGYHLDLSGVSTLFGFTLRL